MKATVTPLGVSNDATLWDGGNVKVSVDGGQSWSVIAPEGGYTAGIEAGTPNPLSGQPGFGGFSYGWRREVVELPTGSNIRVRFESGTDNLNTAEARNFAGWFIDDVSVETEIETESDAPVVSELPGGLIPANVSEGFPDISVLIADATGVSRAELRVDPSKSSLVVEDVLLEQDTETQNLYLGRFLESTEPLPGDRVAFTIEVEDFDGNTSVYNNNGASFIIEFRTFLTADLLNDPIPSGLWRQDGANWIADGTESNISRSALILDPITMPANTDVIILTMRHEYNLLSGAGGNVKVSADDGKSWEVITPLTGYNGVTGRRKSPDEWRAGICRKPDRTGKCEVRC